MNYSEAEMIAADAREASLIDPAEGQCFHGYPEAFGCDVCDVR